MATGLEQRSLTLVSSSPLVVEGQTLGEVLVYDDLSTKRPADYFELHDNPGDLIAVGGLIDSASKGWPWIVGYWIGEAS